MNWDAIPYFEALTKLSLVAQGLGGECPICKKPGFVLKIYEDGTSDPICDDCSRADLVEAARRERERQLRESTNGSPSRPEVASPGPVIEAGEEWEAPRNGAAAVFEAPSFPAETEDGETRATDEIRFLTRAELRCRKLPESLIDGLLSKKSFSVIYGPSNAGKTLLAMDLLLCIVKGGAWCERPIAPGPVVYVNADAGEGFTKRLLAWEDVNGAAAEFEFYTFPERVNFTHAGEVVRFVKAIKKLEVPPVAVAIDTLARCYQGSENDAEQMGAYVQGCDYIRKEIGAMPLTLHHTGKSGESERGSNALRAAADTMIEMVPAEARPGELKTVRVRCEKQRDLAPFDDMEFVVTPHMESVYLVRTEPGETLSAGDSGSLIESVVELIKEVGGGVSRSDIAIQLGFAAKDFKVYRALTEAVKTRRLARLHDPRDVGKEGRKRTLYWVLEDGHLPRDS